MPYFVINKKCHFTLFINCFHYYFHNVFRSNEFFVKSIRDFMYDLCCQPEYIELVKLFPVKHRIFLGLGYLGNIRQKFEECNSDKMKIYVLLFKFYDNDGNLSNIKHHNLGILQKIIWDLFDFFGMPEKTIRI